MEEREASMRRLNAKRLQHVTTLQVPAIAQISIQKRPFDKSKYNILSIVVCLGRQAWFSASFDLGYTLQDRGWDMETRISANVLNLTMIAAFGPTGRDTLINGRH